MIGRNRNRHASRIASNPDKPRSRCAAMAKSTIMIPFFLTIPMSRMTPIRAITLKSKAEHHVDDDERGGDQIRLAGQRRLEGLGVALEASTKRGRHVELGLRLFDRLNGLTQGDVRR